VQPGTHLLLDNLNMVDPEILWNPLSTLYFLDSCGSQQSKDCIITGAGPGQPGKSYLRPHGRDRLTNLRKSLCNCPHRSAIEKCCMAIKIRDFSYLCSFFFEIFLFRCAGLVILHVVHLHPV
jgi:hypothetical protein